MTTEDWETVSRTLDYILSQTKENPAITGVRGELPAKEKKPKKKEPPAEQL